jgi:hypothetical protein
VVCPNLTGGWREQARALQVVVDGLEAKLQAAQREREALEAELKGNRESTADELGMRIPIALFFGCVWSDEKS